MSTADPDDTSRRDLRLQSSRSCSPEPRFWLEASFGIDADPDREGIRVFVEIPPEEPPGLSYTRDT